MHHSVHFVSTMRATVSSLAAFAVFIALVNCGIHEKRIEKINKDLKSADSTLTPINRKKKSATTTFCVEIRPSEPYQKPFQICEPSYGHPPAYGLPSYSQPSYQSPSYESPSYPPPKAPYPPAKPSYVAPAPAYPSKGPSYNAPASKGYTSPHAAYSSYRAGDGDSNKHGDTNDHPNHRATEESQSAKSGDILKSENEELERARANEEEEFSSTVEVDPSSMPRFSEDESDDEFDAHTSMRTAYDGGYGGYGIPPSYPGHKHKKGGHAGLVITCQPNLAGYAPAVPHYGGYGHYRASARSYGYSRPYGYGAPSYKPAAYPPVYSPPAYSPPAYKPPAYPAPGYAPYKPAPYKPSYPVTYSVPPYKAPVYPPPAYKAPSYGPPIYKPPSYGPPAYPQPAYKSPAYAPYKAPPAYPSAYPSPPAYAPAYKPPPPTYSTPEYKPPPVYKPVAPVYKHPEPSYPAPQPEYTPPPSYRESESHAEKTEPLKLSDNEKEAHTIKKMSEVEQERSSSNWNSKLENNKSSDDEVDDKVKARAKEDTDTQTPGDGTNLQGTWNGESLAKGGWEGNMARSDNDENSSKHIEN